MSPSTLPKKFLSHLQLLLTLPLFYRTHPWRYLQGAIGMAIIGKPHQSLSRSQTKTYGVCDFETIEFQVHWQFTFKVCNIHQCFPSSGPTSERHLPVKLKQKLVPKLQHTIGIPVNDFFWRNHFTRLHYSESESENVIKKWCKLMGNSFQFLHNNVCKMHMVPKSGLCDFKFQNPNPLCYS